MPVVAPQATVPLAIPALRRWLLPLIGAAIAILLVSGIGIFQTMRTSEPARLAPAAAVPPPKETPAASSTATPAPPNVQEKTAETPSTSGPVHTAEFVGGQACASCHATETAAWKTSHHALAMQHATAETMLGDFNNATFTKDGVTSTFFKRGDKFFVNTDGPDGALKDYELSFTFGIQPLQQYLVDFGKGRYQALPIAWDTRPKAEGGQRWFHLYPDQAVHHDSPLHWTGVQQNWNYMCAECHSTKLERNYTPATDSFATSWSEVNVSCEACHGPGSNHVRWAKGEGKPGEDFGGDHGLVVALTERGGTTWELNPATGNSKRSSPRTTSVELETCAKCHSRRGPIWDQTMPPASISDTHRIALLNDGLYFPDGQIHDEVFEYGSFLQSRMAHAGITCSDCHEPHSAQLRVPGNGVCLQCHEGSKFDVTAHTHHPANTPGSQCASCHMPQRTYMVVDPRRDHSLRIPRPDLSVELGTPNACNTCHTDQDASWAAAAVKNWFPNPNPGFQAYAHALDAGNKGSPGARPLLMALANDKGQPGIARASALDRIDALPDQQAFADLQALLRDPDPLVRRSASEVYSRLPPQARVDLFAMLDDPIRDVRISAVLPLAGIPAQQLDVTQISRRDKAVAEYIASQQTNADRPEAHQNLAVLYMALGRVDPAETELQTAIRLDPTFIPSAVTLADLYRASGRDPAGEAVLRAAIARMPQEAAAHGALGLWLVRNRRGDEAMAELKLAAELGGDDPRNAYVYAVALASGGDREQALKILQNALGTHPYHRDSLYAAFAFERDAGDLEAARRYAVTLSQLEPGDNSIADFVRQFPGSATPKPAVSPTP